MSPTCLDGIRALIYLWLGICYSLWHCNCFYFIGCLKQFNMVGSRRGCIPTETQQVRAGWLETSKSRLLVDSPQPRAMEGLPENEASNFSSSLGASPSGSRNLFGVRIRSSHSRGILLRDRPMPLWKQSPHGIKQGQSLREQLLHTWRGSRLGLIYSTPGMGPSRPSNSVE